MSSSSLPTRGPARVCPGPFHYLGLFLTLGLAAWLPAAGPNRPPSFATGVGAVPARAAVPDGDRIIIRLKSGKDATQLHRQLGTKARKLAKHARAKGLDLELVEVPKGARDRLLKAYRDSGLVEYAEPDYIIGTMTTEPNDFRFWDHSMWHLQNNGIYGGTPDADIDADNAWDTRTSAADVIVAVVDTGVRYTHEDLVGNMWNNPGEMGTDANGLDKRTNGIDDDNDGYIDDVHGISALNHSGNPMDVHGHGTHVAGIIGATANNSIGITGVCWRVQLMACQFLDQHGQGTISGAIECLDYARAHGAKIINASWGGYGFSSQALQDAITNLNIAGIIFVAAAGNSSGNNDVNPLYPASYPYDNIISVAATTRTDAPANWTNYGATSVDLAAPGAPIFSTWYGSDSDYRYLDGTSQSSPVVAGAAALIWAHNPSLTYREVIQCIVGHTDPIPAFAGYTVSGGRLNLNLALAAAGAPPAGPPPARTDVIWVEDGIPIGAWTGTAGGDAWNWITANPTPVSGTKAHQSNLIAGYHDHSFSNATVTLQPIAGDILFLYVYVDPANPPREIMVSWNNGSWEHRAYWGENLINYGQNGTASRLYVGPVPTGGGWVRLEVPAASVGLVGSTVRSMSFSLYDGRVTWDKIGRNTATQP
ncbi:MAG TPA: S8 family peptidase [Lacunisphaera sp.]|nr:S8 family peptidase [Lacunisphaera sp.]